MSLEALQGALVRMNSNGLRGGLTAEDAEVLVTALSTGTPLAAAAGRVGLDARLTEAVLQSRVGDVPAVLAGQARIAAALEGNARRLRAAGFYPLVLASAVLVAGAIIGGVMTPAMIGLSLDTGSPAPLFLAVGLCAALLVVLSLAVLGRMQLPLLSGGWPAIHRTAFLESLDQLIGAGALLPAAIRASAVWCLPAQRDAAEALVHSLESGTPSGGAPLLHPVESSMLISAAQSGTVPQATAALTAQQQVRLSRILPGAIMRIHTAALLIAGGAVLAIGIAFFSVYGHVLAG